MKNKNINEQIDRIKSLFTEERLYGNLSEQKFDSDEFFNPENFLNTTPAQSSTRVEKIVTKGNTYLDLYNLIDKGERTFIRENKFYKTYINAINNWNKVNKEFGWEQQKIISGFKSLGGEYLPNTIINPTDLLKSIFELFKTSKPNLDKLNEQFNYTWDSDKKSDSVVSSEPSSIGLTTPSKTKVDNGKLYTHKGDPYEYKYYEEDDSWFTRKKGSNGKWVELDRVNYGNAVEKLEKRFFGEEWMSNRDLSTYIEYLENIIQPHNQLIAEQSIKLLNKVCGEVKIGEKEISSGQDKNYTEIVKESLKIVCKNNGGVFMYKKDKSNYFCECVVHEGVIDVKKESYGIGSGETFKVDLKKLPTNVFDDRGTVQKVIDWGVDCADDWHCIADLASIAVLLIPGVGLPLSGLIDLVSAIGYVVEKDDGWELMAGLTILGTIFSFAEAKSLVKGGKGFSKKLMDLNNILTKKESKNIKYLRIREWSKNLTKEEKKFYKEYRNLLTRLEKQPDILKNLSKDFNSLNNTEKGYLKDFLKGKTDDEIRKLYKESGYDLKELVKKTSTKKLKKDASIQGGLFIGSYIFLEPVLVSFLEKLYNDYKLDPFGVIDKRGKIKKEIEDNTNKILNLIYKKEKQKKDEKNTEKDVEKDLFQIVQTLKQKENLEKPKIKRIERSIFPTTKKIDEIKNKNLENGDKVIETLRDTVKNIAYVPNGLEDLNDILNEIKPITVDSLKILDDKLITFNNKIEPLKNKTDKINENMKINEEIKRIKSLFGNERLYGNLVNEQCTEDEAIELLKSKGYMIGDTNPCYDPLMSDIGKVIKLVKEKYSNDVKMVEPKSTSGGNLGCCNIKFLSKKSNVKKQFIEITFFDFESSKRFVMYYKYGEDEGCKRIKDITLGGINVKLEYNPTGKKNSNVDTNFNGGARYGKIEGDWVFNPDKTDIIFSKTSWVKNLNDDFNTKIDVPELVKEYLGTSGLVTFPATNGMCVDSKDYLSEKFGDFNTPKKLDDIIKLIK